MVRILTANSNNTFKSICESIPHGGRIDFYTMPLETKKFSDDTVVLSYLENDEVKFVKAKSSDIGNDFCFTSGQKITMFKIDKGEVVNKHVGKWEKGVKFKGEIFCYGQSIFVNDYLTRDITKELCHKFEKNNEVVSYRVVIGGYLGDSLYSSEELKDNTITCNSSASIESQFKTLYTAITKALMSAHEGKNVVFALDSMTRLTNSLNGIFANSHILPGGVSFDALNLTTNLLKLAGHYNKGTLTFIGICDFNINDRAMSTIYQNLKEASNAFVILLNDSNFLGNRKIQSISMIKPIVEYPYITILGKKLHY